MTVKELKKTLKGVPDHIEVKALKDGVYCEKTAVWAAGYINDTDDDGQEYEEFVVNC